MDAQISRKMGRRRRVKRGVGPPPDPIVVPVTGEYNGNDGPWSTFAMRVGSPPQLLKVLASTAFSESMVIPLDGCNVADPQDCPVDRGQLFDSHSSSSWQDWPNNTIFPVQNPRRMPIKGFGWYGLDTVSLGPMHNGDEGSVFPNHAITQVTSKDYFLGSIGISARPPPEDRRREGHGSNLVELRNRGMIPSLSYGFTAGARNRRQGPQARPAHANLVLGGYDASLIKPNGVDFKMAPEAENRDLGLTVRSIGYSNKEMGGSTTQLWKTPFSATVDTTLSHLWLPMEACYAFEDAFHLNYNTTTGLYMINETQHTHLQAENPSVFFTLANDAGVGPEVTISFQYSSFELRINQEYPGINKWSRYFPIRRAERPEQYTIGRMFFQEAYLVANYEKRNFSISQRSFDTGKPEVMAIRDPSIKSPDDISGAATYGLIAGGCALAGILMLFLVWRCARRREKQEVLESGSSTLGKTELDSTTRTIYELDKAAEVYEMSGKPGRVEAANPDQQCQADEDEATLAQVGPFELPANESIPDPPTPHPASIEEIISPIDGTISSCAYTISTFGHTVSPVTPIEPRLPSIREKS